MRKRRILVVDDSMTSREVFSDELRDLGYEPITAESAEEALEFPAWEHFDAYLLDIRLPGMSGFDLLHRLKKVLPRAIVVLVTQFEYSRPDRAIQTYENVWFFRKPTDINTLAAVLKNAFEAQELQRDVERLRSLAVGIKSVGQVRDLDQEFKVLLHLAVDSMAADAGAIYLLPGDGTEDSLNLRVGVGLPELVEPSPVRVEGVLRRCLDRQEAVLLANARVAKVPELQRLFPRVGRLHVLTIPLTAGHKLIGVLGLYRDPERAPFTEKDAVMARLYAATAAVALENLRLSDAAQAAYRLQVEAQRELMQSRKLSSLGQVTAGISHEIRNPLTVILGNVDLVRKRAQDPDLDTYLDRIRDQCDRVLRLVNDLKAVYHPGESQRSRFRLRELVEEALALAPPPAGSGPIEVHTDLAEGDEVLEGDFSQLLQVVINILSNSYQSMAVTGGALHLEARRTARDHLLEVRDAGPGIPEEIRGRIFEPFFTTKRSEGTGLGLWISQTILRSHGGGLEVVDHPAGGACFHLKLPRELVEEATPVAPELVDLGSTQGAAPLARILIVDDEREIVTYLAELLESEGYTAVGAEGVREAEELLAQGEFDLMILDGNLRGALGREFFIQVVRPRFGVPAIFFTGSDETSTADLLRAGFSAVVRKPARGSLILETVRRSLLEHVRVGGGR